MLTLATAWRLPLNEAWFVPWSSAATVEEALHRERWTMCDADAQELLGGCGVRQAFLTHGETQGEVLEGFVLMALDASVDELAPLVSAYEAALGPRHEAALETAQRLGVLCARHDASLIDKLDTPSEQWANWPEGVPSEPVREAHMKGDAAWKVACACDGRIGRLFTTLRAVYSHRTHLKVYAYHGALQLQVEVKDDQIFFGWTLHMALNDTSPLFRGMVVTVRQADEPPAAPSLDTALSSALQAVSGDGDGHAPAQAAAAAPPCRVLSIAKLKCLNYILRTFGVRNLLPTLLRQGPDAYLRRTENFFRNWEVPEPHRPQLRATFAGWAGHVGQLGVKEREELDGDRSYLKYLEPFLRGEAERGADTGTAQEFGLDRFHLVVCNLTGKAMPEGTMASYAPGMLAVGRKARHESPRPGTVSVVTVPPGGKALSTGSPPTIVLVLPPDDGAPREWHAKAASCESIVERFPALRGRIFRHPLETETWRDEVARLAAELPAASSTDPAASSTDPAASEAAAVPSTVPSSTAPLRVVVLVVGLPPGGGKSSLFAALASRCGATIVSSDAERARSGETSSRTFDAALRHALRATAPGVRIVGYDKNVPNADGLRKAVRVLADAEKAQKVRVAIVAVAPSHLDFGVAWARVAARTRDDVAMSVYSMPGGAPQVQQTFRSIFYEPSLALLPTAHALPGVITSGAFWEDHCALDALAARVHTAAVATAADGGMGGGTGGVPLAEFGARIQDLLEEGDGPAKLAGSTGHLWACAQIPASRLHLTLVRPPKSDDDNEGARRAALGRLRTAEGRWVRMRLVRYVAATENGERGRRAAFWEVAADVDGLEEREHFAPQRTIYHVTDLAALVNSRPSDCASLMQELRSVRPSVAGSDMDVEDRCMKLNALGGEWVLSEPVMPPPATAARAEVRVAAQVTFM